MTTSPEPHAHDADHGTEARPGPVYGQEGAYTVHPGATTPPVDAATPRRVGPAAPHDPTPAPVGGPRTTLPPYGSAPQAPVPPVAQGYPQPGHPSGGHPGYPVRPPLPRNDLAVWSLVLGLLGVLGCVFFTGIPAVVVGHDARRAVAAGEADNGGTATAGIVLGWVATGLGALVGVVIVLVALMPLVFAGIMLPIMG